MRRKQKEKNPTKDIRREAKKGSLKDNKTRMKTNKNKGKKGEKRKSARERMHKRGYGGRSNPHAR